MISATQLRPGMVIKFNNELYSVFSVNHRTPGNLRGFVQVKMRSLRSGSMTEHRFSSEDRVEKAAARRAGDGVPVRRRRILLFHEHGELRADAPDEGPARRRHPVPDSAVEGQRGILRRQAHQRGTAGHRGPDGGRNRAGHEGRHGFQRHQAGQAGNRAWWCRCRRSSPKARRSASTPPKALTRNARSGCGSGDVLLDR